MTPDNSNRSIRTTSRGSRWDRRLSVAISIGAAVATGVLGTRVAQEMLATPGWDFLDFCWLSLLAIMATWLGWTVSEMWNLLER